MKGIFSQIISFESRRHYSSFRQTVTWGILIAVVVIDVNKEKSIENIMDEHHLGSESILCVAECLYHLPYPRISPRD